MKILNYTVLMTPDETGGYVVTCPALPGLVTEGDTLEEARENLKEAVELILRSNRELVERELAGKEVIREVIRVHIE